MLTVLSLIITGLVSNLPLLIKLFDRRQELKHELEAEKIRHRYRMAEMEFEQDVAASVAAFREGESLRRHDMAFSDGGFFDTLRASIRPIITYLFFGLFLAVKGSIIYNLFVVEGIDVVNGFKILWDEPTQAMFGAIMGFWFGGRMIEKVYGKKE